MEQTSTDKAAHDSESVEAGPRTAVLDAATDTARPASAASPILGEAIVRVSPTLQDATDRYRLARPVLEI